MQGTSAEDRPLAVLSAQELVERARPRRLALALRLPLALLSALGMLALGMRATTLLLALVAFALVWFALSDFATRAARPYGVELRHRAWLAGLGVMPEAERERPWARERLGAAEGPELLLVLRGASLPHGGIFWLAAALHGQGGHVELRQADRGGRPRRHERTLATEEAAALRRLADEPQRSTERFEVKDGAPCDLLLFRGGVAEEPSYTCNMAAQEEATRTPTKALCRLLYEIASRDPSSDDERSKS